MKALVLLGLLLGLHAAVAIDITKEYGFCPKYAIQMGDTLFELGKKLNVTQDALTASANACGANLQFLQIGEEICLPGWNSTICDHVLDTDPDRPWCQAYETQQGDTIKSIAAMLGMTDNEFITLNSDYLEDGKTQPYVGQYVRMPGWNQELCRDFQDNNLPSCRVYTVQAGDSATMVATRFKVSLKDMLALNNLTANSVLQPNFQLKLPVWNSTCPPQGIPAELPADTVNCRVTVLAVGSSLAALAVKYSTNIPAIQAVNPKLTNVTTLQPGTYVNVPPFPVSCVGEGNLVDVPGKTTVPADFDYNGLKASAPAAAPAGAEAPAPATGMPVPAAAPAGVPTAAPTAAPVPSPSPSPSPSTSPSPAATPATQAPAPTAAPSSGVAPTGAIGVLAALLALLAGAALL